VITAIKDRSQSEKVRSGFLMPRPAAQSATSEDPTPRFRNIMRKLLTFLTYVSCAIWIGIPAWAGSSSIEIDKANGSLTIEADNASIDDVLNQIGEANGFEVTRNGAGEPSVVSGQYEGTIKSVVSNILKRENHMIVYSPVGGISRIILYRACKGIAVPAPQERLTFSATQPVAPVAITTAQPIPAVQHQSIMRQRQQSQPAQRSQRTKQTAAQTQNDPQLLGGRKVRGGIVN
jgi:hypothetical protein